MKKILLILCGVMALLCVSCTKSCICETVNGEVTELDVLFMEECDVLSSDEYGSCS